MKEQLDKTITAQEACLKGETDGNSLGQQDLS